MAALTPNTGNNITAHRLQRSFGGWGRVDILDVAGTSLAALDALIQDTRPAVIVALHALRAGQLLMQSALAHATPGIVILGGTDANVYFDCAGEQGGRAGDATCAVLRWTFAWCRAVVCFNDMLAEKYGAFCTRHRVAPADAGAAGGPAPWAPCSRLCIIGQAVDVDGVATRCGEACSRARPLAGVLGVPPDSRIVLLVAGLRSVKDPTFLCGAVRAWHAADPRVHLVIVGPELEHECGAAVRRACGCDQQLVNGRGVIPIEAAATAAACASSNRGDGGCATPGLVGTTEGGVWYHPAVPRHELLHWMRECVAVVNSSLSEGQSNAVLEAMALGKTGKNNSGDDRLWLSILFAGLHVLYISIAQMHQSPFLFFIPITIP